ncbi:S46 family peptidase [Myxococcaceae bacterium GXIMD 01537]
MKRLLWACAALVVLTAGLAGADEGMWTFNNFPSDRVAEKYGFRPSPRWLDHVRLSAARIAGGCSASFVSPTGLVMTNHHCARDCAEELSTAKVNYIADGFYAQTLAQERKCPAMEINTLLDISDVTQQVNQATQGLEGERFQDARKAVMARLESQCATSPELRCDVVSLYQGGRYNLYKYRRYQDVRLVFVPEEDIAFFGGDPDNFEFPRYDFDVAFVRVYDGGKPAAVENSLKWSEKGAQPGELTFVAGHPGRTSRLETISTLAYQRDFSLPERLFSFSELRGTVNEFQKRGPEYARTSNNVKFGVENSVKAFKGRREALVDPAFFQQKEREEKELRDKVLANPELAKKYGPAWDNIARANAQLKDMRVELRLLEQGAGGSSMLFAYARELVRAAAELPKPNEQRLKEYGDARLPELKQVLFSPAPVYPQVETMLLGFYLGKLQEQLGPDHPVVKELLGKKSPDSLAKQLVSGTRLGDPKVRQQLFDGGAKAVDASKDPMIVFARALDDDARAVRTRYENEVESVLQRNSELVARARFDIYGTNVYPDATFTLRLSYGQVKGYVEDGKQVVPMTVFAGLFERAIGEPPFKLPASWLKAKSKLDLQVPMNFVTTNDIIGGNSGSPVINQDAEVVGLVFDGNIQSLGGEYGFDESVNRTVAVASQGIIEGLDKVYNARRLLEELRGKAAPAPVK